MLLLLLFSSLGGPVSRFGTRNNSPKQGVSGEKRRITVRIVLIMGLYPGVRRPPDIPDIPEINCGIRQKRHLSAEPGIKFIPAHNPYVNGNSCQKQPFRHPRHCGITVRKGGFKALREGVWQNGENSVDQRMCNNRPGINPKPLKTRPKPGITRTRNNHGFSSSNSETGDVQHDHTLRVGPPDRLIPD